MQLVVISREDAEGAGLKRYFTGFACIHGHLAARYVLTTSCVECADGRRKRYRAENADQVKEKARAYQRLNREAINRRSALDRHKHPERTKALLKRWKAKNRDRVAEYERSRKNIKNELARRRQKERRASDPLFGLAHSIRATASGAFRRTGFAKTSTTGQLIGCDWPELKRHIERQFLKGMTWENRGSVWHVDHILPLAGAKDLEDLRSLCHFTNLRPLWAMENRSKSAKRLHLI